MRGPAGFSAQDFDLLLLLRVFAASLRAIPPTRLRRSACLPPLKIPPASNPPLPALLPRSLVLSPPLPPLDLLLHSPHLPPFLLHLRLDLLPAPLLPLHQHLDRLPPPRLLHLALFVQQFRLGRVDGELALSQQQRARVGDAFVQVRARGGVQERDLGFFQAVEGARGKGIGGFVRVDEEGERAVLGFYLGVGNAGLEVEDRVADRRAG